MIPSPMTAREVPPVLAYRRILSLRIERNRRRLLHDQDGRGNRLTHEQRHALQVAVRSDDCDWFRSWCEVPV